MPHKTLRGILSVTPKRAAKIPKEEPIKKPFQIGDIFYPFFPLIILAFLSSSTHNGNAKFCVKKSFYFFQVLAIFATRNFLDLL